MTHQEANHMHLDLHAKLVDTTSATTFRAFGTQLATGQDSKGREFTVYQFATTFEIRKKGTQIVGEFNLASVIGELAEKIT